MPPLEPVKRATPVIGLPTTTGSKVDGPNVRQVPFASESDMYQLKCSLASGRATCSSMSEPANG